MDTDHNSKSLGTSQIQVLQDKAEKIKFAGSDAYVFQPFRNHRAAYIFHAWRKVNGDMPSRPLTFQQK